jgi:two-component system, chemotaxis family, chemotaxis protein CheY
MSLIDSTSPISAARAEHSSSGIGAAAQSLTPLSLRVLIVDDQPVIRGVVRSALEKLERGLTVIEADNGDDALAIMRNTPVDIIFCDIQMPGITGPEALAHAYGAVRPRPFIILMSTHQTATVRELGRRVGIYEFLPKPFKAMDVINAVYAFERLRKVTQVLLVDDSATTRKLVSRIIDKSQFQIALDEADSGVMALRMSQQKRYDIVFVDVNMPEIDGIETTGLLLQNNPAAQIVVISTEHQTSLIRSAQFAGAFAFLKKPFEPSDVDAVLHDAFALKRPSIMKHRVHV